MVNPHLGSVLCNGWRLLEMEKEYVYVIACSHPMVEDRILTPFYTSQEKAELKAGEMNRDPILVPNMKFVVKGIPVL
jgi:hypothetical protein